MTAQERLEQLRGERAEISARRTKENVRELAETWLAAALGQVNGSTNYVLNGHISPAEVQAVLSEYLLASGALVEYVVAKVEPVAEMTNRQKAQRLGKLDSAIAAAEREAREAARAEALAAVERQFGGVAA